MAAALPKSIVIKSFYSTQEGHVQYKDDGSVALGEQDVFSTRVKIEVERASSNPRYVHLRFSYSNRYWARKAADRFIVAESKQPVENTSSPSCTLFEAVQVNNSGVFYLRHVQSGGRLRMNNSGFAFYVDPNPGSADGYLTFVDWDTLVKLPARVAFKAFNESYLGGMRFWAHQYLQATASDPNDRKSGYRVDLMPDGHVKVYSELYSTFWWRHPTYNWIWVDSDNNNNDNNNLFWPVKIDDNTVAFRNKGNNNFCRVFSTHDIFHCLNAAVPNITNEARVRVEELVMQRSIYNVRYRMEDARIFDEAPFVAGTTQLTNDAYEEASMSVTITYEDSKSYTYSRGLSVTAGVTTTFKTGIPFIMEGQISVTFEMSGNFQWDTTNTETKSVTATGSVPIPARTRAIIEFVGTRGTCNIPYSYTQQDRSSTDGRIVYADLADGSYTGVSCYNYHFTVKSARRL